jgi:type VI secretion system protein ImpM
MNARSGPSADDRGGRSSDRPSSGAAAVALSRELTVGLFGKLPSHGDFLKRRVSDMFQHTWDEWLQECLAESQAALGAGWLDVYLTSPVWRFACAAGACGSAPVVGLMVPSMDNVERCFPLTLVAELPPGLPLLTAMRSAEPLLSAAERLVLDALDAEKLDFDDFDARLEGLGREPGAIDWPTLGVDPVMAAALTNDARHHFWQLPLEAPSQLAGAFEQLLSARLASLYNPLVVWWSEGSSEVEPSCVVAKGLPTPSRFVAMLKGDWSEREWCTVPVEQFAETPESESEGVTDDTVDAPIVLRLHSAATTDVGRVRKVNQDACLERSDVGLWVVADGLGGHSEGEVASQMVCDALADLVPESDFEVTVESARARIRQVNDHLYAKSVQPENPVSSGSTVVALLIRGPRAALVWAGDSRIYRWRDGRLEQLTRDHSVAEEEGVVGREEANVITRAVGGEVRLDLDTRYERVRAGDRFLLCSDGLTKVVPDADVAGMMKTPDLRRAVDALIHAALEGGGPDNVTALVVEAAALDAVVESGSTQVA